METLEQATKYSKDKYVADIEFFSPINRETSFGSTPLSDNTKSTIHIEIEAEDESGSRRGHFEWDVEELEETEAGGLWFERNELIDYDGVFELPKQLIDHLKGAGFNMDWAE